MTQALSEDLVALLGNEGTDQLDDELAEMVPPLLQKLEQEDAAWRHVSDLYNKRKAEHEARRGKRVRILKALGWEEKKTRGARKSAGGEPKPSPESVERLVRWVAEQPEAVSYNQMAEGLGISSSSATKQATIARELDLLRHDHHGGSTGRMMFFTVFEDAVKRLDEGSVSWPQR